MKNFLLDLSNDLRAKRLWPVAIVLLLALVAVPVVLSKSSESTPPPAPAASAPKTQASRALKELTAVKLDEGADSQSSPLNTFDPANPFKPPAAVIKRSNDDGSDVAAPTSPLDVGALTGGGDATGEPTSPGTTPPTTGGEVTKEYEWVIDVTFGANGKSRRIKTLERLDMLPRENDPLLIFLGVTPGGGSAVFLVDSSLIAAGEGTCKPSDSECALVYLGAGSEHGFTNDQGDSYDLRINEIRKVEVDPAKQAKKVAKSKGLPKGPKAAAAVGTLSHRFVPTLISDLVSVSSPDAEASTPTSDRR